MKNIATIVLSAAALALTTTGCGSSSSSAPAGAPGKAAAPGKGGMPAMALPTVGVDTVREEELQNIHRYSGRVLSPETVAVVPQVSGRLVEVAFREGSTVAKGDLLYRIDDTKYAAQVASARATLAKAEAASVFANKSYDRTKALFDRNVASAEALDAAESERATALAAVDAAKAALTLAQDDLEHCRITAEIGGKVGLNVAAEGNYVTPASGALTTVVRQDSLRVAFSMATGDLHRHYGSEAMLRKDFAVRIKLSDGSYLDGKGEVEFIANAANATTDTVTVYVRIANPDGATLPGASVTAEVEAIQPVRKIVVPVTATQHERDTAFVWVIGPDNMPQRRPVETGLSTTRYEVIESGLKVGETIVVAGTHKVLPNVPVVPVSAR